MKAKFLGSIIMFIFPLFADAQVLDRKFECRTDEGESHHFEISFGAWQDGVGYTRGGVIYADGTNHPLHVNMDLERPWRLAFYEFNDHTLNFLADPTGYGFQLSRRGKEPSFGTCQDRIYTPSIWPYETSDWELFNLSCEDGKNLPLPEGKIRFHVSIAGYGTHNGKPVDVKLAETVLPMIRGQFSASSYNSTCSKHVGYSISILDSTFAISPLASQISSQLSSPFKLVKGSEGGSSTGSNCPMLASIKDGILEANRNSVTAIHGDWKKQCTSGQLLAKYRRVK